MVNQLRRDLLGRLAKSGAVALLLALAFFAGCREAGPGSQVFVRNATGQNIKIAVLPFASPANAPGAGEVITSTVITYLLSTGAFDVVEPGLVEQAIRAARYVPESAEGLDRDTLEILQKHLKVDAYLVGRVEEFGEVRIGPDTYPSISFSARLIRASDATILWATSISRTGADKVKIFDIGRVSSVGKLAKAAVAELAESMRRSGPALLASLAHEAAPAAALTPTEERPLEGAKFQDESVTYGAADLKALLPELSGFTRGEVRHSRHFHDTAQTTYATDGATIDVRLVDYTKIEIAAKFISQASEGMQSAKVEGLAAFSGLSPASMPGYLYLNVAMGRFGLYLSGPESKAENMRKLAAEIVKADK